ncbi:hypothetical protein FVE85_0414 [Porphyridium purpureum]|uniref:E3 ubiquitin protein ligase n=1 Tax=Porphyridium purpureum TaxID=35688 RepID=A0A5J4YZU9_PORPP|nr:hypothetical protein FVE85_0414 [Porphyridium purpureum]|eukprot:POR3492..scf208_2
MDTFSLPASDEVRVLSVKVGQLRSKFEHTHVNIQTERERFVQYVQTSVAYRAKIAQENSALGDVFKHLREELDAAIASMGSSELMTQVLADADERKEKWGQIPNAVLDTKPAGLPLSRMHQFSLAALLEALNRVLHAQAQGLADDVRALLNECHRLHAQLRYEKMQGHEVRFREWTARNRVFEWTQKVHAQRLLLAQWDDELKAILAKLPESAKATRKEDGASSGHPEQRASTGAGAAANDDVEEEAAARTALVESIALYKKLLSFQAELFARVRGEIEEFVARLKEPLPSEFPENRSSRVQSMSATQGQFDDVMHPLYYAALRFQWYSALFRVQLLRAYAARVEPLRALVAEVSDDVQATAKQVVNSKLAAFDSIVSEASKISSHASQAFAKIQSQLEKKMGDEHMKAQATATASLEIMKLRSVGFSSTLTEKMGQISALTAEASALRASFVQKIGGDEGKTCLETWETGDNFWAEAEGLLHMVLDLRAAEHGTLNGLVDKQEQLIEMQTQRLQLRQKLISAKEANKSAASHKAVEQRNANLEKTVQLSKKLASKSLESAQEAEQIKEACEERLHSVKAMIAKCEEDTASLTKRLEDEIVSSGAEFKPIPSEEPLSRKGLGTDCFMITEKVVAQLHEHLQRLTQEKLATATLEQEIFVTEKKREQLARRNKRKQEQVGESDKESVRDELYKTLKRRRNCSILPNMEKDCLLPRCGHVFSREGIVTVKSRKCPICHEKFSMDELISVYF